jgi:hypothetical protein
MTKRLLSILIFLILIQAIASQLTSSVERIAPQNADIRHAWQEKYSVFN